MMIDNLNIPAVFIFEKIILIAFHPAKNALSFFSVECYCGSANC